jgi:mono/diheme cytochrome c family protein
LRNAPTSHFYDVMTNGFGAMPSYAEVLTPEDRWKIIAYIRALQQSQNAKAGELAEQDKQELEKSEKAGEKSGSHNSSGTGATAPTPASGGHGN